MITRKSMMSDLQELVALSLIKRENAEKAQNHKTNFEIC
jgi:hypothetical protein